jgi:hypothetical protein
VFDSPHDYNKAMREAMYGWMTLYLKGEGGGESIPEPAHTVEKPEDLACFPDPNDRPKGVFLLPDFAAAAGRELVAKTDKLAPDHPEMWEATAFSLRDELKAILGDMPTIGKVKSEEGLGTTKGNLSRTPVHIAGEAGLPIHAIEYSMGKRAARACVVLHLEGKSETLRQAAFPHLLDKFDLLTADLRATGETKRKGDAVAGALDHNSAEYGVWIGRPLLGQWVTDVLTLLDWLSAERKQNKVALAGFGPAGIVALVAAALFPDRVSAVLTSGMMASYVTNSPYASGTPMGVLAPGILKAGDIPHLAGLIAPRRLVIADGVSPQGKKLSDRELQQAFAFTRKVYTATKAAAKLTIATEPKWEQLDL